MFIQHTTWQNIYMSSTVHNIRLHMVCTTCKVVYLFLAGQTDKWKCDYAELKQDLLSMSTFTNTHSKQATCTKSLKRYTRINELIHTKCKVVRSQSNIAHKSLGQTDDNISRVAILHTIWQVDAYDLVALEVLWRSPVSMPSRISPLLHSLATLLLRDEGHDYASACDLSLVVHLARQFSMWIQPLKQHPGVDHSMRAYVSHKFPQAIKGLQCLYSFIKLPCSHMTEPDPPQMVWPCVAWSKVPT